jgi:hypothetical protein
MTKIKNWDAMSPHPRGNERKWKRPKRHPPMQDQYIAPRINDLLSCPEPTPRNEWIKNGLTIRPKRTLTGVTIVFAWEEPTGILAPKAP